MTIEERAKAIVAKKVGCHSYDDAIEYMGETYIAAMLKSVVSVLTLQCNIDIDNAVKAHCQVCQDKELNCVGCKQPDAIRRIMEEGD